MTKSADLFQKQVGNWSAFFDVQKSVQGKAIFGEDRLVLKFLSHNQF